MAQLYFYYSAMNAGKSTALLQSSYNYQERGMQVHELSEVVDELDIPVLCYGLRTDFRGELFIGSQYLLAWSDKLVELKTICFCGRKASMVLRLDQAGKPYAEGEQVVIGGNERYVSVCRKHYKEALVVGSLTAIQDACRR